MRRSAAPRTRRPGARAAARARLDAARSRGTFGLSPRFLVQLESGRGNISVRRLADVARALDTTAAALLTDADEPASPVIALLGLRGAGKTTVGRRLARRLRVPFVELDRRVEQAADLSLGELFTCTARTTTGDWSRKRSNDVLAEARGMVIATGGGIVTSPETFERLRRSRDHGVAARDAGGSLEPRGATGRPAADGESSSGHGRFARPPDRARAAVCARGPHNRYDDAFGRRGRRRDRASDRYRGEGSGELERAPETTILVLVLVTPPRFSCRGRRRIRPRRPRG